MNQVRRRFVAATVAGTVVLVALALAAGQRWVPSSDPLPDGSRRVLVVGIGPLGFDDLGQGNTRTLDALFAGDGATGAMSTRTVSRSSTLEEGYLSLGAGYRVTGDANAGVAYDEHELSLLPGTGAADPSAGPSSVSVVGAERSIERNQDRTLPTRPGALADALHAAGRTIAVLGNSDVIDPVTSTWRARRPAALAAMDSEGRVDAGVVSRGANLVDDPSAPFGARIDVSDTTQRTLQLLATHDVVIADPGELARFERWQATPGDAAPTPQAVAIAHGEALARTDQLLGRLIEAVPDDVLVIAMAVDAGGPGFHLSPAAITGAGVEPGELLSPSTKRSGVVLVTDLAPTILEATGAPVPEAMVGHAIRYRPGEADLSRLEDLDRDTAFREATYGNWVRWYITGSAVAFALALVVALTSVPHPHLRRLARTGALACAAFPLATFLFRALPDSAALGTAAIAAVVALDLAAVAAALRWTPTPLHALQALMATTVGVILLDTVLGTPLHVNSWLGYSLHGGGRFYGIPNTTYALLAAGAVLLVTSRVLAGHRRDEALLAGAGFLTLVLVVDGAPGLGGDVGGIVSLAPVFGGLLLVLAGRRIRARSVLAIGGVTATLLAAATALDLARPAEARTHLGRFAGRVADHGLGEILDTFLRKQDANLSILQVSTWVRMVLLLAVVLAVLLGPRQRRERLAPRGSAVAIGTTVTLVAAVVGFLTNDSGPIVIGLFATFLLPFVVLPALDAAPEGDGSPDETAQSLQTWVR